VPKSKVVATTGATREGFRKKSKEIEVASEKWKEGAKRKISTDFCCKTKVRRELEGVF
jgi:hypothetical protein